MKKRKFIERLNPRISPIVYIQNPQDLKKAYDYAARTTIKFDLRKQAEREVSIAEQIEALQIQLAELTTGQTLITQPTIPAAYYTLEANWTPPLNRPYETIQPQQNNWNPPSP